MAIISISVPSSYTDVDVHIVVTNCTNIYSIIHQYVIDFVQWNSFNLVRLLVDLLRVGSSFVHIGLVKGLICVLVNVRSIICSIINLVIWLLRSVSRVRCLVVSCLLINMHGCNVVLLHHCTSLIIIILIHSFYWIFVSTCKYTREGKMVPMNHDGFCKLT